MSLDFISMPPHWDVGQSIDYLRENDDLPNEFYEIYLLIPP